MGEGPQENEVHSHYLGRRKNVKVGQIIVCSCHLWHATALPCPLYGQIRNHEGLVEEHYVTYFDFRLHLYLGGDTVDVDDQNLTLPKGEPGFTARTTYCPPEYEELSRINLLYLSSHFYPKKQIDQTEEFVLPQGPHYHSTQSLH
jgi:hypothetical protein